MVLVTLTSPALGPVDEAEMPTENPILSDEECLKERKWWCFLLSSIFTFLMGVLSVVVVRGITSICCHKDEDEFSQVIQFFGPRKFMRQNGCFLRRCIVVLCKGAVIPMPT